jgi:hypothetical protein
VCVKITSKKILEVGRSDTIV